MVFPPNLKDNEFVCLLMIGKNKDGKDVQFHKYVKNFEQYCECVKKYKHNFHVYNALATVKLDKNGEVHRREANMRQRRVLFIDYDKKDYPDLKEAYEFTKLIKDKLPDLFLHAYYDSGHGYHFYVSIPPTCKIREINEFNKEICSLIGADTNACKVTQVARIPCTFNMKSKDDNGKYPMVKEIDHYKNHPYSEEHYHPCNLEYLKRRVANAKKLYQESPEEKPLEKWDYAGNGYDVKIYPCLCTEKILKEGAEQHQRNTWLGRIISMLSLQGYTETKIREICLDWNTRCRPPKNINTVRDEINRYLEKTDIYKLNGCWENITDERVKEIVHSQCDKYHCMQSIRKREIPIEEDIGVKFSQRLLTESKMRNDKDTGLSGYEYLVMTVLYKYIKPNSKSAFRVKDLKMKMQWKKSGKWKLCIDIDTFKKTLSDLVEHKCIELIEAEKDECKGKKPAFDDTKIKIKRGLKIINDRYIEFYYSAARAFIAKQITQNEFKIFLCIVNNIKENKSCTLENLSEILHIDESNVLKGIKNLEVAQCLEVIQYRGEKGKYYNWYSQIHTDKYNNDTFLDNIVDVDTPNNGNIMGFDKLDSKEIGVRLLA